MDDFAGWPVWGWFSLVVFLASIRYSVCGHSGPQAGLAGKPRPFCESRLCTERDCWPLFGELYRRYGLEWAMASHFGVDIVAHVALALTRFFLRCRTVHLHWPH